MASKTISDRGATDVSVMYVITRNPVTVTVQIGTTDGDNETVSLDQAEVVAATTAGQRAALVDAFDNALYSAALEKLGFE